MVPSHLHFFDFSVVVADSQVDLFVYVEQVPNVTQPAPFVVHALLDAA